MAVRRTTEMINWYCTMKKGGYQGVAFEGSVGQSVNRNGRVRPIQPKSFKAFVERACPRFLILMAILFFNLERTQKRMVL